MPDRLLDPLNILLLMLFSLVSRCVNDVTESEPVTVYNLPTIKFKCDVCLGEVK